MLYRLFSVAGQKRGFSGGDPVLPLGGVMANNPPNAPVGHDQSIAAGTSVALSTLFTNFTDPDAGDSITAFYVRDRTVGGGHLTLNGVAQADDQVFGPIPIGQLNQWAFVAGSSG